MQSLDTTPPETPPSSLTLAGHSWSTFDASGLSRRRDHIRARAVARRDREERVTRAINVVVALVGLVLLLPLLVVIAIAVKLTSRGPVIYTQERVGLDRRARAADTHPRRRQRDHGGRLFRIYKFRTMSAQTGPARQVWAGQDEHRITPIGGFLRQYRLDEIPQLYNVLTGDMNIVGPRPEQPAIFQTLRSEVSGYAGRQRVLPGITGWAQINLPYDQTVDDVSKKLAFDLHYIETRSPLRDIQIMARTMPVMVFGRGAQ